MGSVISKSISPKHHESPGLGRLQEALDKGYAQGVAPALVLLLWKEGAPAGLLCAGAAEPDTVFDLASLTKPLATAPLAIHLAASRSGLLTTPLGEIWGEGLPADKQSLTLERLLNHSSGLPAYQPYFNLLLKHHLDMRKALLKAMLFNEPLAHEPGSRALYSDLGYMLAGLLLESIAGKPLGRTVAAMYRELGIQGPVFLPLGEPRPWPLERIAPCGPLPGRPVIHGEVEDENAHALGGVAGHAGLFGTASQVAGMMSAMCKQAASGGFWPSELAGRLFTIDAATPGSTRTMGFDTPSGELSAAGPNPPVGVVGHLGFTGVSLWWQPAVDSGVVLLTNRVAHGRDNHKIKEFRHQVHALAWPALGLA